MSEPRHQNPYQPPESSPQPGEVEHFDEGLIWRRGEFMVLRFGAAIPNRCFITGEETSRAIEVVQKIRPSWVYLYLLAGIVPYFFIAPYVTRHIRLRVPISQSVFERHMRVVNRGFALILVGVLVAIAGAVGGPLFSTSSFLLPLGIVGCLIGLTWSSEPPVRLQVEALHGDLLVLGNIHHRCLACLPEESPEQLQRELA